MYYSEIVGRAVPRRAFHVQGAVVLHRVTVRPPPEKELLRLPLHRDRAPRPCIYSLVYLV